MKKLCCLAVLLVALFWTACTSGQDITSDTNVPAAPTGTLVLEHSPQARALDSGMTHLVVRGLTREGRVLVPSQAMPLGGSIRVELPVTVERLQLDYQAGDTKVGEYDELVALQAGQETRLDPDWVAFPQDPPTEDTQGADLESIAQSQSVRPVALPPYLVPGSAQFSPTPPTLPSSFTISGLPPVGKQGTLSEPGSPGTCVAWSFGYGLGGYTASRNPDGTQKQDITQVQFQPSPAFLFANAFRIENLPDCSKSSDVYLPFMVFNGSATQADVEYYPDCKYLTTKVDSEKEWEDRFNVQIGSYYTVYPNQTDPNNPIDPTRLQQFLASGQPVAFAGAMPVAFSTAPVFDANGVLNPSSYNTGGHGMLLVGYNNAVGSSNPEGAFLIQNSMGPEWGVGVTPASAAPAGQLYWNYQSWLAHFPQASVAYPVQPNPPSSGVTLSSTPSGFTTSIISAATQVTGTEADGQKFAYLVLSHWFDEPVTMVSLAIQAPSGTTLTQSFPTSPAQDVWNMQNGYTYLMRQDGKTWQPGSYNVTLTVLDAQQSSFTLTGTVTVTAPPANFPQYPSAVPPASVLGSNRLPVLQSN